jgi:GNAT superfamily N-acetyltransferase
VIIRSARESDIPGMMDVRNTVKENRLVDPSIITEDLCRSYILERGKGWVCLRDDVVAGFGIVDFQDNNIWALFIRPEYEGYGCGSKLHDILLDWYFAKAEGPVWLSTDPKTRAEAFYLNKGWTKTGTTENGEVRFEMSREAWQARHIKQESE